MSTIGKNIMSSWSPAQILEVGGMIISKGIEIGYYLGEKINGWIDDLYVHLNENSNNVEYNEEYNND